MIDWLDIIPTLHALRVVPVSTSFWTRILPCGKIFPNSNKEIASCGAVDDTCAGEQCSHVGCPHRNYDGQVMPIFLHNLARSWSSA